MIDEKYHITLHFLYGLIDIQYFLNMRLKVK